MSEPPPKPASQDPALADFWEQRYRNRSTPWDAGDRPVVDSLPVFQGRERWQIWRRRG